MTTISKDEVVKMSREAGAVFDPQWGIASNTGTATFERFAALCRAPLVAENAALNADMKQMGTDLSAIQEIHNQQKAKLYAELADWKARAEAAEADLEQTQVQLAGCGVAAMQNTEGSKAHRVERGAYGWSASYGDVCSMVDREIELRAENARLKDDYQNACKTVAEMHAAAVGQIVGPNRGVVEDVADLRAERDDWKARAEAAEAELERVRAVEPVAGDGARLAQELWLSVIRNIAYQNNGNSVLTDTTAMHELKAMIDHVCIGIDSPPQPAAQEPVKLRFPTMLRKMWSGGEVQDWLDRQGSLYTSPQPSAVPVVEQLVEALDGLFSGDVVVWSLGGSARPRAAITAGRKFIKENGK